MSIPSNINTDITKISNAKTLIRNAINAKGVSVSADDTFASYAQKISQLNAPDGYKIIVVDYDGEIITQVTKQAGETFTLPEGPTNHSKLVFQEWSSCDEITNNTVTVTDHDILVGAVYTTASGTNEFDIALTETTGKDVTFKMVGTKNWGDGTSDSLTTHTYADYGEYTITCDGTTLNQSYIMGQSSSYSSANFTLKHVRLATVTSITSTVFYWCAGLETVTMSTSLIAIGTSVFQAATGLKCCVIPSTVTSTAFNSMFQSAYKLKCAIIPNNLNLNLNNTFYDCENLEIPIFPSNCLSFLDTYYCCYSLGDIYVPALNNNCTFQDTFYGCHFRNITFGTTVCTHITSLQGCFQNSSVEHVTFLDTLDNCTSCYYMFYQCTGIESITIPSISNTQTLPTTGQMFYSTPIQSVQLPNNLKYIGTQMFYSTPALSSIIFPDILEFGNSVFYNGFNLKYISFLQNTTVPIITSTTFNTSSNNGINKGLIIYVPRNLYQEWIRTENWADLKSYIYGGEPTHVTFSVTPSTGNEIYTYDKLGKVNGDTTDYIGTSMPYVVYNKSLNFVNTGTITNLQEGDSIGVAADLTVGDGHYCTITVNTGQSYCLVKLTMSGVDFILPEDPNNPGVYTLKESGTYNGMVDYEVSHALSPFVVKGSIQKQPMNQTINVALELGKGAYTAMEYLTSADEGTNVYFDNTSATNLYAYRAFDNDYSSGPSNNYSYWVNNGVVRKYNTPVCINKFTYYPTGQGGNCSWSGTPYTWYIDASNDGTNWENIGICVVRLGYDTINNGTTYNFDNNSKYSYYKFRTSYTPYSGSGGSYNQCYAYMLDCPTFDATAWAGNNYTFNITMNVEADTAYVINSDGDKFPLLINDNTIKGIGNFTFGSTATLCILKEGYKSYTETITMSDNVTRNIILSLVPYTVEYIPVNTDTPIGTYYANKGWHYYLDAPTGYIGYESNRPTNEYTTYQYSYMKITMTEAKSTFAIKICAYGYNNQSYSSVYACTKNTNSLSGATHTTTQTDPSNISGYTTVTYTDLAVGDYILIGYRNRYGYNANNNAGYVLIDPNQ